MQLRGERFGFTIVELGIVIAILWLLSGIMMFPGDSKPENRSLAACNQKARVLQDSLTEFRGRQDIVEGLFPQPLMDAIAEKRGLPKEFFVHPVTGSCSFEIVASGGSFLVHCPHHSAIERDRDETFQGESRGKKNTRNFTIVAGILVVLLARLWSVLTCSQCRVVAHVIFGTSLLMGGLLSLSALVGLRFWHPAFSYDYIKFINSWGISIDFYHSTCVYLTVIFALWFVFQGLIMFCFAQRKFPDTFSRVFFFCSLPVYFVSADIANGFPVLARLLMLSFGIVYLIFSWRDYRRFL